MLTLAATGCSRPGDENCVRVVSWAGYKELAIDEAIVDSFEVRHPHIPVCYESLEGSGVYREKVLTSIAAGTPPGVFLLDGIDIPAFVSRGVTLDLAPFVTRVGLDTAAFQPGILHLFMSGGHLWAFPKDYTPMVIYYNKDMFDRAGVPYPKAGWTWRQFLADARRLTRDTNGDGKPDEWGFGWPRDFFYLQSWIWAGGGDLLSPDGRHATGYLDSPATDSAVQFYLDLVQRYHVAARVEMFRRTLGIARLFYSGKVAMMQSGHWDEPTLLDQERHGRLRFGVAPMPMKAGVAPVTPIYASGWAVPRDAPHRKWSVEVAAFLSSRIAQRVRARDGLAVSAMPAVAAAEAASDTTGRERVFIEETAHGRQPWGTRVVPWREIEDALLDLLDRPLVRHEPVPVVAHDIALKIDAILARSRKGSQ